MTLAGLPSRRRGTGFRWITIGVVATVLILLVDASLKSRSATPTRQLATGAWVDQVLPVISASTGDGQVLASIWSGGLSRSGPSIASAVDSVAANSAAEYATLSKLNPPSGLVASAGLLEASLLARSQAASIVEKVLLATLGAAAGPSTRGNPADVTASSPSVEAPLLAQAASDIGVGDQAYSLFRSTFPASAGVSMPPSVWGGDTKPYQSNPAQVFLTSLQSVMSTTPAYQFDVFSLSTNPAPLTTNASTLVLPDASAISANLVVANTGNQPASHVTVTATISPAGHGSSTVRDFVDLAVGQAYAINRLGPLNPPLGTPVTLTVTVTVTASNSASASSPTSATTATASGGTGSAPGPVVTVKSSTSSIVFEMPAPPPATTTTVPTSTAKGATSTTRPTATTTTPSG